VPDGYGSLRPRKQRHLAGSVRLRNRCYGNSQIRPVRAPPSRTNQATFGAGSEGWYPALNHTCYLWLGRRIAAASCSKKRAVIIFAAAKDCRFSHGGPASNPAHKRRFSVGIATSQSHFLMERAMAPAISLSVKQTHRELSDGRKMVLSFRHRVSITAEKILYPH
jgi:hypothetical protein